MLQLSSNRRLLELDLSTTDMGTRSISLAALRRGDDAIVERIDLPEDDARRLMELGFVPGTRVAAGCSAPGGDPRVFQVDGSEIALRRETAIHITVLVRNFKRG
jgi:ferrous iron transport protein A